MNATLHDLLAKVAENLPEFAAEAVSVSSSRVSFESRAVDLLGRVTTHSPSFWTPEERGLIVRKASTIVRPGDSGAMLRVRMPKSDFDDLPRLAKEAGFDNVSEYVRFKVFGTDSIDVEEIASRIQTKVAYLGDRPRVPNVMKAVREALAAASPR
jgi:hypothetical protein